MLLHYRNMPSASTIYKNTLPEHAQNEKEHTRLIIVNTYNNDTEYKAPLKARALAYYYKKKQEKQSE